MSFVAHAQAHGLILHDVIADGRWHRVPTEDHPRKKNGAYLFDGRGGVVRNWATMENFATWRDDAVARVGYAQWRSIRAQAHADEAERRARAQAKARDMVKSARLVVPQPSKRIRGGYSEGVAAHPYLIAKGLPEQSGLVVGDCLLIPMHDCVSGELLGAQTISANGTKLFLPGTRAKGAVHRLGRGSEVWLVEGYATGVSVQRALQRLYRPAEVVVCFSASNLTHVAGLLSGRRFVVADNDASGTGQRAAEATGLPRCMPPQVGDANDLHQAHGEDAVRDMLKGITTAA
jgi:putative DNA primase/helicase